MKIIMSLNYEEMSKKAAEFLLNQILQGKRVNIGLATGNTPTGMYGILVKHLQLGINADNVHYYNIDEYCGVNGIEKGTCNRYLQDHFYQKLYIAEKNIHFLNEVTFKTLDSEIIENSGLDTIILGIGENGHIAYNEPGTNFGTLTHTMPLTCESKMQHSAAFGGLEHVPDTAVTMGIKTIMNAKNVL